MDKKTFHPTELQALISCPHRYQLEYETEKQPWPKQTFFAGIRGTIFHKAVEHKAVTAEALRALWDSEIRAARLEGTIMREEHLKFEVMQEQIREYWHFMAEESIVTVGREVPLSMKFGAYTIETGGLDHLCRHTDTPEGMIEVHDYKSGYMPAKPSLNRNLQFGLYHILALRAGYNVNRMWWCKTKDLERYKSGAKQGQRKGQFLYPIKITDTDAQLISEMTHQAIKLYESGARPWNPGDQCEFCQFAFNGACPKFQVGLTVTNKAASARTTQAEIRKAKLTLAMQKEK